jgi:ribosomal-protein-alanine N-acetyltransferase
MEKDKMIYTKEIHSERLILRKVTLKDTESLYKNWDSDVEMHKFVDYELHTNIEDTEKLINKWILEYEDGRLTWVIETKENGEAIGVISASRDELDNKITEVGFSIGTKHQGNGYATEALKVIIEYLIFECGLNIVKGGCYTTNVKSARTMLKAGMKEIANENKEIRYFEVRKDDL